MANGIAIIGIGCRFPGSADDPRAFWQLLAGGVNAVGEAPADRPGFRTSFDADPARPGRSYSRWGGFLERVDLFDAAFFGISPREAAHIDPQHRLLLELLWEACEDAGVPPPALAGSRTGVFIGISTHDYGDLQMYPAHRGQIDMHTNSGTATSIAANRLSYVYDLRGPSVAIDTACSSSLTALHFACQSLRAGESDLAVAGGVQVLLTPELTIGFCKASMLSPDGECRAFDDRANGYVRGEGGGILLLKPLEAALRDGDSIYATIRATAANQDGRTPGMTVPSPRAQAMLIEEALGKAGLAPADVQYVEAHGPGTRVGDPIEASAISAALSPGRAAGDPCLIGSVKTNLGHLEAASGMPGVIKVALALERRMIPASLHFREANKAIDLPALGLRVVTELEAWPHPDRPAIAGVNSFGFGGANAHALLEEAPRRPAPPAATEPESAQLFVLSAKSAPALSALAAACAEAIGVDEPPQLTDLCFTSARHRAHHDHRLAFVANRTQDLARQLHDVAGASPAGARIAQAGAPRLGFVFSGMGPQWWGMGRQLRESEPVFRRMLERCDEALRPYAGWSLLDELAADQSRSRVASPELAQVTNFAIQVALADLWASFGITPAAVIGHSGGAMAAAYVAGVYDLDEAIHLSYHRSRLQGRPSNAGRMLAVGAPYDEIAPLVDGVLDRVSLAAVNGPSAITLAGDPETLERIAAALLDRQVFAKFLAVTIAYHSPAMDPIRDEFLAAVSGLRGRTPRIPWVSDTTGAWTTGVECDGGFWWRAIRQPVLFRDGTRLMLDDGIAHFVEISPHPVLGPSIAECMKEHGTKGLALPSLRRNEDERTVMLRSVGALYTAGCMPEWRAIGAARGRFVRLPLYPWQRERHWFEPPQNKRRLNAGLDDQTVAHPLLGARLPIARPAWEAVVGVGDTGYLRDHLVQSAALFPGAGYVEMALAAAATEGQLPVVLRDVEFLKALRLDVDNGTLMQIVVEADGRFEILSSSGAAAGDRWIGHARGVVAATKLAAATDVDLEALRARAGAESNPAAFYAQMADRGLGYGPAFRGIRKLWSTPGEAVAEVINDLPADAARYRVHPALLDAAFQVLVAASDGDSSPDADRRLFLPTGIREARLHAEPGAHFWVTATVRDVALETVTGDVRIINDSGQVCLDVIGLTAQLVDVADRRGGDSIDQWLYAYRWEPQPRAGGGSTESSSSLPSSILGPVPAGAERDALVGEADAAARSRGWSNYYDGVEARLDAISAAYIVEAFSELGCRFVPGARVSPDAFAKARTGWRRSLADELCRQLETAGFLRSDNEGWQATGAGPAADASRLCAALLRDYPGHRLDVELLARCGPRVADVLKGHVDGREVLFTGDGFAFLERFYRESPAAAFYNAEAARVLAQMVSAGSASRPLRVLEVGAGTGGTTSLILPELAERTSRYVFSDASPAFLERARAGFQAYPFLTTAPFDITRDAGLQGFEPQSFDVVIAANVLHATPDVDAAVARLEPLIAAGGALLLLEITRHPRWLDIVFGLTDGWWALVDRERRPVHPLMSGAKWAALLTERGFDSVAVIADTAVGEPAQSIIVGHKPTSVATRPEQAARSARWVLLADRSRDVGRRLAAALAARGHECDALGSDAEVAGISEQGATFAEAAGVIDLRTLDAQPTLAADAGPGTLSTCGQVLPLLQQLALLPRQADRLCVVVTAGAQSVRTNEEPALMQAPVWGIGRTVRKEWPAIGCRLVDLSEACDDGEVEMLADELVSWAADAGTTESEEEEIAFRSGTRFVHRLRNTSRARIADETPLITAGEADGWRAEIPVIGALDSIVLRSTGRRAPGPNEVEVAVEAASLNFRDVVVATGIVQGLEASDTFGGRRLGIDLAGTVTRCGANVTRLAAGDAVFGIGQGTFASHVVTDAALVVRRPARLSAEDASAIPVAFVTVWYALRRLAQLRRGETVLIHAASGGVGLAAIQIAKSAGARVFATAGSPAKRQFVESLGVELVMDSRTHDFADQARDRTGGRGVDVVLNSLAGDAIARGVSALAPYGRFVELGKADIYQNRRLDLGPFRKNLSLFAVDLDRMCFERPVEIGQMLQEVADEFAAGGLQPPPRTGFAIANLADAMRYMAQARHIGKVVVTMGRDIGVRAPVLEHPPVHADATYLITGGLGGLGLVIARWLIERGARTLVLAGRSAPSADVAATLAELGVSGARVETVIADVSSADEVRGVIAHIRSRLPPLRGIVHAAMVLDDRGLAELDAGSMTRVMAPKALGAWHLDQATLDDELDFFVSYSSITSWLGNPLQANYAAANAFLDAFAAWRRCQGRPATTINWGVIAGAGYVARHREIETYLNRQGYSSFTPDETLDVLSELLRHGATNVMAARIDWARFGEVGGKAALSPQLRHLVPDAASAAAPTAEGSMRLMLADADAAARIRHVEEFLRQQVAKLLGAKAPALDVERPILDLGLDSLIAVELSSVIEKDLGVEMTGATLLGGFTIRGLATEVLGRMQLSQSATSRAGVESHAQTPAALPTRTPAPPPVAAPSTDLGAGPQVVPPPVAVPLPAADTPPAVDYSGLNYSRWSPSQRIVRGMFTAAFACVTRVDAGGLEHIPREGACVIAVNHLSMVDVPLMLTLFPRRVIILATDRLKRFPILDWFVSDMGQAIYVAHGQAEEQSLQRARAVLDSGGVLALAPEGTRSRSGLLRGQTGVAYLATQAGVPVVPVVAWGQEQWRTGWRRGRLPIVIRAGAPMHFPAGTASPADLRRYTDHVMTRMAELLPPEYRGAYGVADAAAAGAPAAGTGDHS